MSDSPKTQEEIRLTPLFEVAVAARDKAYAPYSDYKVGAAIVSADGVIHSGCNVEAANLKGGTCAETTAIAKMVCTGQTRIKEVLVVGLGNETCPPCGHCRQLIREFADADTRIYGVKPDAEKGFSLVRTYTMEELLPDSFGPNNLASAKAAP